jgi:hypothetical protein
MPDHANSVANKFTIVDEVNTEDSTLTSFKGNEPGA